MGIRIIANLFWPPAIPHQAHGTRLMIVCLILSGLRSGRQGCLWPAANELLFSVGFRMGSWAFPLCGLQLIYQFIKFITKKRQFNGKFFDPLFVTVNLNIQRSHAVTI